MRWLRDTTAESQDAFKAGIAELENNKRSMLPVQLYAEIDTLARSCLSAFAEKMRVREAIDAATEKLQTFIELEATQASQTYTKKATIEQRDVQNIVHRAVVRMKNEVDSEVSIYNEDSRCCGSLCAVTTVLCELAGVACICHYHDDDDDDDSYDKDDD